MSIIKPRLAKAAKLPEITSESPAQKLIDHILAEKTTELSKAIDDSIADSLIYGTSMMHVTKNNATITATIPQYQKTMMQQTYPPRVRLNRAELETHPAFELTVEQLRAAWMLAYGSRWVSMEEPMNDDYLNVVTHRLISFGELEVHDVTDQYTPMGRIKI